MSTHISWTDETWNPVTGCSRVSEGCRNCYAAKLAPRLAGMGQKGYTKLPWTNPNASKNVFTHEDRLEKPLKWKKPRRVFVNSMSDLFHEQVPDAFIDKVFAVMALAPQHTFQILTKRPERMAAYLSHPEASQRIGAHMTLEVILNGPPLRVDAGEMARWKRDGVPLPLANVWPGTSVEDQRAADERIPHLLRTPAAVRFLSCEPLIGGVDLDRYDSDGTGVHWLTGLDEHYPEDGVGPSIDWVIAGGESGPGHRPMKADWVRSIRQDCLRYGVAFFFKQWGGRSSEGEALLDGEEWRQFPVQEVKHG